VSAISDLLARGRQEFAQNARLRIGVLVIAAILAFYSFLVLKDLRSSLQDQYVERRQYLRKLRVVAVQKDWPARAEEISRVRRALEAQIPVVASPGLAQASAQTWLRDLAAVHGEAVRVQSQPPEAVEGTPGLWRVPMVVSGSLPPRTVINLIQNIEKRGSLAVIEEALILNRQNQTFQLTVVSYARVAGTGANATP
jgi:hypothetical protein